MNQEWTIHGHRQHCTQDRERKSSKAKKNTTLKIKTMLAYKHKDGGYETPYHLMLSRYITYSLTVEHSG